MKNLNYKKLVAYASAFVSFVLPKVVDVDEIILFGSVARNEADKKSDIDLFFNLKKDENKIKGIIKKELGKFYTSKIAETWYFKGIKNEINIEVGNLDKWKLKRSIISDGIVLYGKYKEVPEKLKGFAQFTLKPIKNITKRNKIIRRLFGRKEKRYSTGGLIEEYGKKVSVSSFIVPIEKSKDIIRMLNKEKIDYSYFEFWSDAFL